MIGLKLVHPFWIKKIEEQRRDRNTLFWVVFFIAVVFPICLVGKLDTCVVFSICCFAAAMTRLYYYYKECQKEEEQKMLERHQEQALEQNTQEMQEEAA
ncbi:MAG: hypothetical protein IPG59_02905 [Candidatus Melainabacteria bacterium]|nr:MAG: hypothetical protein IPG59_02905 [Candidatus Melainabacteria bacterium]